MKTDAQIMRERLDEAYVEAHAQSEEGRRKAFFDRVRQTLTEAGFVFSGLMITNKSSYRGDFKRTFPGGVTIQGIFHCGEKKGELCSSYGYTSQELADFITAMRRLGFTAGRVVFGNGTQGPLDIIIEAEGSNVFWLSTD